MHGLINKIDKSLIEENSENLIYNIKKIKENKLELVEKHELFKFSFCLWYIMAEWGRISNDLEDYFDKIEYLFIKSYETANNKYSNDEDFIFLFGYMLDVFPEHFQKVSIDYLETKERGVRMICSISQKYPLAMVLSGEYENDVDIIKIAKLHLNNLFGKNTFISQYFCNILDMNCVI